MRLSKIVIRKFKAIDELEITIPAKDPLRSGSADFISIVGQNNAGKSSVMEALYLACPFTKTSAPSEDDYPYRNLNNGPIEIELEFNELNAIDKQQYSIRGHVHDDKFRIKKTWGSDKKAVYQAFAPSFEFPELPDLQKVTNKEKWLGQIGTKFGEAWRQLTAEYETANGPFAKFNKDSIEKLKRFALEKGASVAVRKEASWREWVGNPGGINANLDTVLPQVIFVPAIRETREEADTAKTKSAIHQIVKAMFDEELNSNQTITRFKEVAKQVEGLFTDDGKHRVIAGVEGKISNKIKELIDVDASLSFTAPDMSAGLAENTQFWLKDGDLRTKPEYQGHGAQRAVVLSLLQLFAEQLRQKQKIDGDFHRSILLLIEEPEIYLHPEMCRRMRDVLLRLAQSGKAQVVCTTHSPVFLDLADRHDGIVILRRERRAVKATQCTDDIFGHESDIEQRDHLRMVLNFNSFANEAFFTNQVCLVEGDTEIAALDAIAIVLSRNKKIDWAAYLSARRRLAIINCRGKWTIPYFQNVLNSFKIDYRVIHDRDPGTSGEEKIDKQIIEHLDGLESRRRIHDPNFEGHLFSTQIAGKKKHKPWNATKAILEMSSLSDELIMYFQFALGETIGRLQAPALPASTTSESATATQDETFRSIKRNHRNQVARVKLRKWRQDPDSFVRVLGIAAGRNKIPELECEGQLDAGGQAGVVARVRGDSMADTLLNSDLILLRELQDVRLDRVEGDRRLVDAEVFCQHIKNNGIYVLAINNDIDIGAYTLKRVCIESLSNGGWLCRILADNPDAEWGHRGQWVIHRTDRVHFAAELIGLVEAEPTDVSRSEKNVENDQSDASDASVAPDRLVEIDPSAMTSNNVLTDLASAFSDGAEVHGSAPKENSGRNLKEDRRRRHSSESTNFASNEAKQKDTPGDESE